MEEENRRILEFAHLQQQREEDRMEKQKQQEEEMAVVQKTVSIENNHITATSLDTDVGFVFISLQRRSRKNKKNEMKWNGK